MKKKGNILVVDDNRSIRATLEFMLPTHFEKVIAIGSPNTLIESLRSNPDLDVVLLDMNFTAGANSGGEGIYWLTQIKKMRPNVSVVLFTAYPEIPLAVNAIKEGAMDFIEKPWDNNKLIVTLQNAVNQARSSRKIKQLKAQHPEAEPMFWGSSERMSELRRLIEKLAPTDANILIYGENGTGKQLLAQHIHERSLRNAENMVSVDMGTISSTLFESELFGHAKGAFTDAKTERIGKIEAASGSTLFLDEIGNLPLDQQAKILTTLQSRSIVRVGESQPRQVDVRLITATNSSLEAMVSQGEFREDLFYRINTFTLELPPLRERGDDVVDLAEMFLRRYGKKYGKHVTELSASARAKLLKHKWPGNIRELQHTIEKGVIVADSSRLMAEDLLLSKAKGADDVADLRGMTLDDLERSAIEAAMLDCQGNISAVAQRLGITRPTLYSKLKRYGL